MVHIIQAGKTLYVQNKNSKKIKNNKNEYTSTWHSNVDKGSFTSFLDKELQAISGC